MRSIISRIQQEGWTPEARQEVREALVNQPTGRWAFYDLSKCFSGKEVDVDYIVQTLSELKTYKMRDDEYFEEYPFHCTENVLKSDKTMHRKFVPGELVEFWNGTSLTRAMAFLKCGDGYTMLECPAEDEGRKTRYGLQVMLENWRAYDYARRQAYPLRDNPAVIHGWIQAEYLFPANNENEYGIPYFRYDRIQNAEVIKYSARFL